MKYYYEYIDTRNGGTFMGIKHGATATEVYMTLAEKYKKFIIVELYFPEVHDKKLFKAMNDSGS